MDGKGLRDGPRRNAHEVTPPRAVPLSWPIGAVYFIRSLANVSRIRALGKSDRETSLLTRAMGIKALSYIEQRSFPTTDKISARFK